MSAPWAADNPNLGDSVDDYLNSPFWVRKITTYFKAMDVIHDDFLTLSDYEKVAERLAANQADASKRDAIFEVMRATFKSLVAAGKPVGPDTKVGLDEFLRNTATCALDKEHAPVYARKEKDVFFDFIDTNGNDVISHEEYAKYLSVYFGEAAAEGAQKSFESIDANKNGQISREEFAKAHYHYWFDVRGDVENTFLPYGPLVEA